MIVETFKRNMENQKFGKMLENNSDFSNDNEIYNLKKIQLLHFS
jgi:hypothetical protein